MAISKDKIKEYWNERVSRQKELTVGHSDDRIIHEMEYVDRMIFMETENIFDTPLRVLDYGCGIGWYAIKFKNYIGVDITPELLAMAKKRYPKKQFALIESGDISKLNFDIFFSATVLQHNEDDTVIEIFRNIPDSVSMLYLYENSTEGESGHVKGRTDLDYLHLLYKAGKKHEWTKAISHVLHGEKHTLSIIQLCHSTK